MSGLALESWAVEQKRRSAKEEKREGEGEGERERERGRERERERDLPWRDWDQPQNRARWDSRRSSRRRGGRGQWPQRRLRSFVREKREKEEREVSGLIQERGRERGRIHLLAWGSGWHPPKQSRMPTERRRSLGSPTMEARRNQRLRLMGTPVVLASMTR